MLLGCLKGLLKLGQLRVDALAFCLVLLHLLKHLLYLQLVNFLLDVLQGQMDFFYHRSTLLYPQPTHTNMHNLLPLPSPPPSLHIFWFKNNNYLTHPYILFFEIDNLL